MKKKSCNQTKPRLARPLPFPTDSTAPPRRYYSSEQRWLAPVVNRRRKGKIQWSRGQIRHRQRGIRQRTIDPAISNTAQIRRLATRPKSGDLRPSPPPTSPLLQLHGAPAVRHRPLLLRSFTAHIPPTFPWAAAPVSIPPRLLSSPPTPVDAGEMPVGDPNHPRSSQRLAQLYPIPTAEAPR